MPQVSFTIHDVDGLVVNEDRFSGSLEECLDYKELLEVEYDMEVIAVVDDASDLPDIETMSHEDLNKISGLLDKLQATDDIQVSEYQDIFSDDEDLSDVEQFRTEII